MKNHTHYKFDPFNKLSLMALLTIRGKTEALDWLCQISLPPKDKKQNTNTKPPSLQTKTENLVNNNITREIVILYSCSYTYKTLKLKN